MAEKSHNDKNDNYTLISKFKGNTTKIPIQLFIEIDKLILNLI
jgi:hypothetical protein